MATIVTITAIGLTITIITIVTMATITTLDKTTIMITMRFIKYLFLSSKNYL